MQCDQQEVLVLVNSFPNSLNLLLWWMTLTKCTNIYVNWSTKTNCSFSIVALSYHHWKVSLCKAQVDAKTQMASGDKKKRLAKRNNERFCIKHLYSIALNQQVLFRIERFYTWINHLSARVTAWHVSRPSGMYHGHQWAISSAIRIVMKTTMM